MPLQQVPAPVGVNATVWAAPSGTTAVLSGIPEGDDIPAELLWTSRAATIPATRAIVLLGDPPHADPVRDFESIHRTAESVALALDPSGESIGPIDVLILRPRTGAQPEPQRQPASTDVEIVVPGDDGLSVTVTLSVPNTATELPTVPAHSAKAT